MSLGTTSPKAATTGMIQERADQKLSNILSIAKREKPKGSKTWMGLAVKQQSKFWFVVPCFSTPPA